MDITLEAARLVQCPFYLIQPQKLCVRARLCLIEKNAKNELTARLVNWKLLKWRTRSKRKGELLCRMPDIFFLFYSSISRSSNAQRENSLHHFLIISIRYYLHIFHRFFLSFRFLFCQSDIHESRKAEVPKSEWAGWETNFNIYLNYKVELCILISNAEYLP